MSAPQNLVGIIIAIVVGILMIPGVVSGDWGYMIEYIPWFFTALSIIGAILNAKGKKSGFVVWIVSNVGWIGWNWYIGQLAQSSLFVVYTITSAYGLYKWSKDENLSNSKKSRFKKWGSS